MICILSIAKISCTHILILVSNLITVIKHNTDPVQQKKTPSLS